MTPRPGEQLALPIAEPRRQRTRAGLTLADLAEMAHVHRQAAAIRRRLDARATDRAAAAASRREEECARGR